MSHKEFSGREKNKPRGRPFAKGNSKGKINNKVLVTSRPEISIEGGALTPSNDSENTMQDSVLLNLPKMVMEITDNIIKENLEDEVKNSDLTKTEDEKKSLELIESIDFKNGENTLSIRFSKRHNRMFRIQIFLNQDSEIRPVTYNGASTGYTFWNLLKGILKK